MKSAVVAAIQTVSAAGHTEAVSAGSGFLAPHFESFRESEHGAFEEALPPVGKG